MHELSLATVTSDVVEFVAGGVEWLSVRMPRRDWDARGNPTFIEVTIVP